MLLGSQEQHEVTEEELSSLFGLFRKYIKDRDIPEIRKFISSYIERVIIYRDHVEVVFFLCYGKSESEFYSFSARTSRAQLHRRYHKVA